MFAWSCWKSRIETRTRPARVEKPIFQVIRPPYVYCGPNTSSCPHRGGRRLEHRRYAALTLSHTHAHTPFANAPGIRGPDKKSRKEELQTRLMMWVFVPVLVQNGSSNHFGGGGPAVGVWRGERGLAGPRAPPPSVPQGCVACFPGSRLANGCPRLAPLSSRSIHFPGDPSRGDDTFKTRNRCCRWLSSSSSSSLLFQGPMRRLHKPNAQKRGNKEKRKGSNRNRRL